MHPSDPDNQPISHRGPHPQDTELFAPTNASVLRAAEEDAAFLLSRGYGRDSALRLVGDRYCFHQRQRIALGRIACSDQERDRRLSKRVTDLRGVTVLVDGFNILTTLEGALGGAVMLRCRDNSIRDLSGTGDSYHIVSETEPAIQLLLKNLASSGAKSCEVFLDRPVQNSGRISALWRTIARQHPLPTTISLVDGVDGLLATATDPVITSDSVILDKCAAWFNLTAAIIQTDIPSAWVANPTG